MAWKVVVRDPDGEWRDHYGMTDREVVLYDSVEDAEADIEALAPFMERDGDVFHIEAWEGR